MRTAGDRVRFGGLLVMVHLLVPVAPAQTPRAWAPEVADAVRAYRQGDYETSRRLCASRLSAGSEGRWRMDAAVLEAMCLLRMPARSDRIAGRSLLRQLVLAEPGLQDDPECNLAYGIAQTALSETADALESLERAADAFAARGEADRHAETLVALADAWARHGEWELTPARCKLRRPGDAAEANAVKRTEIEALGSRLTALPNHQEPLARLELILARHLLGTPETAEDGQAILARLASAPRLSGAAVAEAALLLAEREEAAGHWDEALRLYDRLERDGSAEAAERGREIRRPQLGLEVATPARSGSVVPIRLRVRGLDAVEVEVRQVDVEAWLGSSRTRTSEAMLPVSGSVCLTRELATRAERSHDGWTSDALTPPLEFAAPPGAYVVSVRARGESGEGLRRLVVVSDLHAACVAGPEHIVVWAAGVDGASEATARFWMNRSFAPTEVRLSDGVARFPWPGDAQVLRDKGWVCLVRCGDHVAVCRGQLPTASGPDTWPEVVLVTGPPAPVPGQSVYVAGLLRPQAGGAYECLPSEKVELQVQDTLGHAAFASEVPVTPGGAFAARVPITEKHAGEHLRFVARLRGSVLRNTAGRPIASVPRETLPSCRIHFDLPRELPGATALLTGSVRADYPWGTALARTRVHCEFSAVQLPTAGADDEPIGGVRVSRVGRLDETGRYHFHVPIVDFGLGSGPLAIRAQARLTSWDGREGTGQTELLVGAEAPRAWLLHEPAGPSVGQEVRFGLGWFQPAGLAIAEPPTVVVSRNGVEVARLRLSPSSEGFRSAGWTPAEPGAYLSTTTLSMMDGQPLRLTQSVDVAAGVERVDGDDRLVCEARLEGGTGGRVGRASRPSGDTGETPVPPPMLPSHSPGVVVARLRGESEQPLLVALESSGDLLVAQSLSRLAGDAEIRFEVPGERQAGLRVVVGRAGPEGLDVLISELVAPDPRNAVQLSLAAPAGDVWPGQTVSVEAIAQRAGATRPPAALMVRLIDAVGTGFVDPAVVGAEGPAHSEPWSTLLEGVTLWCDVASLDGGAGVPARQDGRTELHVPLPDRPGLYKLIALTEAPDGAWATAAALLDARRGVRLNVSVPGRLTLGDRSVLAIEIENGYRDPVSADVQCRTGDGLHVESVRVADGRRVESAGWHGPIAVKVPSGGRVWLYAEVEAARVGRARVEAQVAARGAEQCIDADYEVLPPALPSQAANRLRIQRRIHVWAEVGEAPARAHDDPLVEAEHGHCAGRRWDWVAWSPHDRLVPGQLLKVEDELVLEGPLPSSDVVWSQRIPATCHAVLRAPVSGPSVPRAGPAPTDEVRSRLTLLKTGRQVQEHLLTVVRPGVCLLPPPELRCDEELLPVAVEPGETRLIVVGVDGAAAFMPRGLETRATTLSRPA